MGSINRPVSQEVAALWRERGLLTLFAFAVAILLGAIITFVAHNWVYLSTGAKLGGLGALLIAAAAFWIWRKLDSQVAVSFGIAAQILIGVWLAAAGQIFQAPGGLQDLALNWAVLGLPFALASRSSAHWAVWLGVVFMATFSPVGLMLSDWIGADRDLYRFLIGGSVLGAAACIGLLRQASDWFAALISFASALCLIIFGLNGVFREVAFLILSAVTQAAFGLLAFRKESRAVPSIFAAGTILVLTVFVLKGLWESLVGDVTLGIFLSVIVTGGATFLLIRLFQVILRQSRQIEDKAGVDLADSAATPWYMDVLIAFGGFVTALFGVAFLTSFLGLIAMLTDRVEIAVAIFGAAIYVPALIYRRRNMGLYLQFFLNTLILLGGAGMVGGIAAAFGGFPNLWFSLLLLSVSTLTLLLVPEDRILHLVLVVGWIAGFALLFDWIGLSADYIALICAFVFAIVGVLLATETFAGRRRLMIGAAFLLAAIGAGLSHDVTPGLSEWAVWPRLIDMTALAVGLAWIFRRFGAERLPNKVVLGVLFLIAAILPLGASSALLLLLLGYSLRSLSLFSFGVVAMAYFLFATYFDLSLTLMQLSGMLALTGAGLLGLWFMAKRMTGAVQ